MSRISLPIKAAASAMSWSIKGSIVLITSDGSDKEIRFALINVDRADRSGVLYRNRIET